MFSLESARELSQLQRIKESEFYIEPEDLEVVPVKGTKNGYKSKDGLLMMYSVRNTMCVKNLQVKSDDTFVIGFVKSGTTWVEEIVWLMRNNLNFERARKHFHFIRVPWVDQGFSDFTMKNVKSPRVFKSHLPTRFLPDGFNKTAKVVYVVRNPKDIIVSYYNFFKSAIEDEFIGTLDDAVDLFVEGKTVFGPYWEHMNEYTQLENVHIIHYEDLIEEPIKTVQALAKYLGLEFTEDQIKSLVAFVSFDNMKDLPSMAFNALDVYFKTELNFFKKGQIGNWKNYLTEEQSKRIDDVISKNLKYKKPIKYEPTNNDNNNNQVNGNN